MTILRATVTSQGRAERAWGPPNCVGVAPCPQQRLLDDVLGALPVTAGQPEHEGEQGPGVLGVQRRSVSSSSASSRSVLSGPGPRAGARSTAPSPDSWYSRPSARPAPAGPCLASRRADPAWVTPTSWWKPPGRGTAANEVTPGLRSTVAFGSPRPGAIPARSAGIDPCGPGTTAQARAGSGGVDGGRRRARPRLGWRGAERKGERARDRPVACSRPPSVPSAARPGRGSRQWRSRSSRRPPRGSTCWCRRAPAPASRSPTSCRPSRTPWPPAVRGRLDGDAGAAGPDRRPRPAPDRRRPSRRSSAAGRPGSWSRDGATTSAGRSSCGGFPSDDEMLFDLRADAPTAPVAAPATAGAGPVGRFGREVARLQEWAESTASGDRDELVPGVSERAWRQVVRERPGVPRGAALPDGRGVLQSSRPGSARTRSTSSSRTTRSSPSTPSRAAGCCPSTTCSCSTRAHEFADRVTSVISDELSEGIVEAASKRVRQAGVKTHDASRRRRNGPGRLAGRDAGGAARPGPARVPDLRHRCPAGCRPRPAHGVEERPQGRGRRRAAGGTRRAQRAARRHGAPGGRPGRAQGPDVAWVARIRRPDGGSRTALHVAPLSVAGLLRAAAVRRARPSCSPRRRWRSAARSSAAAGSVGLLGEQAPPWRGLDVGSPFDYPRQGILYVARHLPAPGRDGVSPAALDELAALVEAAGGRTLGLFSSRRAAEYAAAELRERLDLPVLCQGEDSTPTLVRRFAARRARPACSAPCRSGRASTCPARRASWS